MQSRISSPWCFPAHKARWRRWSGRICRRRSHASSPCPTPPRTPPSRIAAPAPGALAVPRRARTFRDRRFQGAAAEFPQSARAVSEALLEACVAFSLGLGYARPHAAHYEPVRERPPNVPDSVSILVLVQFNGNEILRLVVLARGAFAEAGMYPFLGAL